MLDNTHIPQRGPLRLPPRLLATGATTLLEASIPLYSPHSDLVDYQIAALFRPATTAQLD